MVKVVMLIVLNVEWKIMLSGSKEVMDHHQPWIEKPFPDIQNYKDHLSTANINAVL